MPSFREHLAQVPYDDLRAIAARLHLQRRSDRQTKALWVDAIEQSWRQSLAQQILLGSLSFRALAALVRLLQAGSLPCQLFLAEYGALRRPGHSAQSAQAKAPTPWQQPQTTTEELYYAGLLHPTTAVNFDRATRVTTPADLRAALCALPAVQKRIALEQPEQTGHTLKRAQAVDQPIQADDAHSLAKVLLHDLSQLLIFLSEQPELRLLQNRWLPRRGLIALNLRLQRTTPPGQLTSHKQAGWLTFLMFLAQAAGLQSQGYLTPLAWHWLAQPPVEQLRIVWSAWRHAPDSLGYAYAQPEWPLLDNWPAWLLEQARSLAWQLSARQLADRLLGDETMPIAYYTTHFGNLSEVEERLAHWLTTSLTDWGMVQGVQAHPKQLAHRQTVTTGDQPSNHKPQAADPNAIYRLTALGLWLLAPTHYPTPQWAWSTTPVTWHPTTADEQATSANSQNRNLQNSHPTTAYRFNLPADNAPWLQARLAAYGRYSGIQTIAGQIMHCYRLDKSTLAAAAAAQHQLPALWEALHRLTPPLTPVMLDHFQQWHAEGKTLHVSFAALLRTDTPQRMAQLQQTPTLQCFWGELLSPTTTTWSGEVQTLAAALQSAGYYPDLSQASMTDMAQAPDAAISLPLDAATAGSLWLAAQLYHQLGQHLPLPFSVATPTLHTLYACLSLAQQAAAQTQLQQIKQNLLDILDNLPYIPPPTPTNPEVWSPLLHTALAAGQNVEIIYFSAGRNLTTRRLVQPYWLEEHHGVAYLRAYCHQAGRVLTFRLDRIQGLAIVGEEA